MISTTDKIVADSQFVLDCERVANTPKWVFGLREEISTASHSVRIMYLLNLVTGKVEFMLDMFCDGIGGLLRGYDNKQLYSILGSFGMPLDSNAIHLAYKIIQDPTINLAPPIFIDIITGETV